MRVCADGPGSLRDRRNRRPGALGYGRRRSWSTAKALQRARIVLLSAERLTVLEVARRVGISRPAVCCWQRRYGEEGVDGLLRDKVAATRQAAPAGSHGGRASGPDLLRSTR